MSKSTPAPASKVTGQVTGVRKSTGVRSFQTSNCGFTAMEIKTAGCRNRLGCLYPS